MVSVIIPVDERIEYLMECVRSIRRQSLSPKEIIFVFDGHRQGWDDLRSLSKSDSRIKLLHLKCSEGPGVARNTGLDIATGKYIAFCDSDDILPVQALAHLFKRAEKARGNVDVVCGDFLEQFDYGGALRNSLTGHGNQLVRFFSYISVWNRLYKKEFLNTHNIRFPEGYQGEDLIFLADVFLSNPKIAYTKQVVYQWQRHEMDKKKTLTHSASYDGFIELISSWDLFLDKMLPEYPNEIAKYGRDSCHYLLSRMDNIKDTKLHLKAFEAMKPVIGKLEWEKYPVLFYKLFRTKYELLMKVA